MLSQPHRRVVRRRQPYRTALPGAAAPDDLTPGGAAADSRRAMAPLPTAAIAAPVEPAPIQPAPAGGDDSRVRRPAIPKLLIAIRHYSWQTFGADLAAGITVGLVALPLAMAFAIASGL